MIKTDQRFIPVNPNAEERAIWERLERLAAILRNEGIISSEAAAEISGIPLQEFIKKYGLRIDGI